MGVTVIFCKYSLFSPKSNSDINLPEINVFFNSEIFSFEEMGGLIYLIYLILTFFNVIFKAKRMIT